MGEWVIDTATPGLLPGRRVGREPGEGHSGSVPEVSKELPGMSSHRFEQTSSFLLSPSARYNAEGGGDHPKLAEPWLNGRDSDAGHQISAQT